MAEWDVSGEEPVPFVLKMDFSDFDAYVGMLRGYAKGIGIPSGFVPHSTYWLVSEGRLIGVSNLRHALTEKLWIEGGNIGYGIRPSERRKGYASALLSGTLAKAQGMGIAEVLITCKKANEGSARTILRNGGKLDNEVLVDGALYQRYWIPN